MRRPFGKFVEEEDSPIDLTPMLDVVFILLIFFIVTASFVKESGIEVNKPQAQSAVKKELANIFIAINEHDEIWIDKRKADVRSLRAIIERLNAENPQSSIVIQADKRSTNEKLVLVMDAARQAGIYNIAIAAENQ
ncbi:MAG: biopolymer transporter ExbD [Pseudomonadales bacterium]|nr:biopolymer transporter ExbD [Pseudomonadales bacterium]